MQEDMDEEIEQEGELEEDMQWVWELEICQKIINKYSSSHIFVNGLKFEVYKRLQWK